MQKENSKKIGWAVGGIIVLVAVFYGGMVYGGNNVRASIISRGSIFGQNGTGGMMRGGRSGAGLGGFTGGEIISKDDKSITVKLMDGGSKIIFLSTNTTVAKMATGSLNDLKIGTQVSITGTANVDGSVTAQSVQIRPNMPPGAKVQ